MYLNVNCPKCGQFNIVDPPHRCIDFRDMKPIERTPENEDHWAVLDGEHNILFHHENLTESVKYINENKLEDVTLMKLGFYKERLPEWSKHYKK